MQTDIELLSRHFAIEVLIYDNRRLYMAWQVLRRILRGGVGAILFWFAVPSFGFGVSIIARLMRCPIILITGGYDIANMPEINFGSMIRPRLRLLVIAMLKMANVILPFSDFARREVLRYANPRRIVVVYPAVDSERFQPAQDKARECLVVTASYMVGTAYNRQKGLDTFVRAASFVPDARFLVIGRFADEGAGELRSMAPPNVEFSARHLTDEELVDTFQRARVYVQASAHEGFGIALAEAMAAGCVPVACDITAMPEVVGDTGFFAPYGDPGAFGEAIGQALQDDGRLSTAARARVVSRFGPGRREQLLVREVGRFLAPQARLARPIPRESGATHE